MSLLIISPNEVFGDIMVLASPRPPVDPDDVNTVTQPISFKFYMRVDEVQYKSRLSS